MQNVASTLEKSTSFDGFTSLSYVVREIDGTTEQDNLGPETTFSECLKAADWHSRKKFDKWNRHFYTLLRVAIANCGVRYCDKQDIKNGVCAAWKDIVD